MKPILALVLTLAALACAGCRLLPKRAFAAPAGGLAPTVNAAAAIAQGTAAQASADAQARTRDSRVAASIREGLAQNEGNPDGPPKLATRAELELADRTLGVEPSTGDKLAAAERAAAVREGRLEESKRLYGEAYARAEQLNRDLAQARAERDAAQAAAVRSLEEARRQIEENTRENQRKLDAAAKANADLRQQISDENRNRLVRWLTIAAVVLFVAGIAIAALTQGRAIVTAAWFAGGGLAAGAAARVIGHWLFPWFAWGAAALGIAGGAWFLWTHIRTGRALEATDKDRALLEETAAHVVKQIDSAKGPGADVVMLNLAELGRSMDRKHKDAIERLRTRIKKTATLGAAP